MTRNCRGKRQRKQKNWKRKKSKNIKDYSTSIDNQHNPLKFIYIRITTGCSVTDLVLYDFAKIQQLSTLHFPLFYLLFNSFFISFDFNMSLFGEYPCDNMTIPPSYISFTTGSIFIPLTFTTVIGNLLVLLAIFVDPCHELKTPFNYFVANLAVADLLVGLVVDPLGIAYHYSEGLKGRYPASLNYIHVPYFMASSASVLSLAALTFDRYLAITSPLSYRTKLNPKRAGFVSLGIWIFSVGFSFFYLITGYLLFSFIFMHTIILFSFFVMLFTYQRIFKVFRTQVEQWDTMNDAKNDENFAKRQAVRWEQKVTKTFLLMLLFFLSCYFPACICIYITNLCNTCSCIVIHWARDIHFVLILSNSSINPFLYAVRFENFRKAFKKILQCRFLRGRFQSFKLELFNSSTAESCASSSAQKLSQSE